MPVKISCKLLARITTVNIIVLFLLFPGLANSRVNPVASEACKTYMIYENDQFANDRNYTFGILFTRTCAPANGTLESYTGPIPLPRDWNISLWQLLEPGLGTTAHHRYVANSAYFGVSLFTPNRTDEPQLGGRPYSALAIYGDNLVFSSDTEAFKQGLQLGLLGTPWGGKLQRAVHKAFGYPLPQGWSSQISNGGEPTFLYALEAKRLLTRPRSCCDRPRFDLSGSFGGTLGYYNSLQGTLSARLGLITAPFWSDYGPIANHSGRIKRTLRKTRNTSTNSRGTWPTPQDAYLFFSGGVDVVLYNVLLQGQFRGSEYDIAASDIDRVIPHVVVGFVMGFGGFEFSYSYTHRGPEILGGKSHGWSSLSVGLRY